MSGAYTRPGGVREATDQVAPDLKLTVTVIEVCTGWKRLLSKWQHACHIDFASEKYKENSQLWNLVTSPEKMIIL